MKRNIVIEKFDGPSIEEKEIEIVERKGIGHPDYICDACSEAASQALSQYYLKNFGVILHHNLDKGLLVAGESEPKFSGGKILEPIKIIVAGRATDQVGENKIPVEKIVRNSTKRCLAQILNSSQKIDENFKIEIDYKPGAANLQEVFRRSDEVALANDTSFGVSHGPLSQAEKLTLSVANLINSKIFLKRFPFVGRDIKVMTLREKEDILLTFTIPYIDRYLKNVKEYFQVKGKMKKEIGEYIRKKFNFKSIEIDHNTLDDPQAKDESGIYLTVLGLSAEQGDDGQVGRGNRVCGLITPCREMSMEAAAGKNINHPGKLYQLLAHLIAQKIGKIKGIKECGVRLLSQIGKPLDQPQVASVKLISSNFPLLKDKVFKIVDEAFNNLGKIQLEIVKGKYSLF